MEPTTKCVHFIISWIICYTFQISSLSRFVVLLQYAQSISFALHAQMSRTCTNLVYCSEGKWIHIPHYCCWGIAQTDCHSCTVNISFNLSNFLLRKLGDSFSAQNGLPPASMGMWRCWAEKKEGCNLPFWKATVFHYWQLLQPVDTGVSIYTFSRNKFDWVANRIMVSLKLILNYRIFSGADSRNAFIHWIPISVGRIVPIGAPQDSERAWNSYTARFDSHQSTEIWWWRKVRWNRTTFLYGCSRWQTFNRRSKWHFDTGQYLVARQFIIYTK